MKDTMFYEQLLGLKSPWSVKKVDLSMADKRVTVEVALKEGEVWADPTNERARAHIHGWREREWRHLDTCQFETIIKARVPQLKYSDGTVEELAVPWSDRYSRVSVLMEAFVLTLLDACSNTKKVCEITRLSWSTVNTIMRKGVDRGMARRQQDAIEHLGLDEKSIERGHSYASILTDIDRSRVLEVVRERKKAAAVTLLESLSESQRASVKAVAMDMWPAFMGASRRCLPQADIVHDRFHVSKYLNDAVDKVRRHEHRILLKSGISPLTGSKYAWLRGYPDGRSSEAVTFRALRDLNLKTSRAWALKENFTHFWTYHSKPGAERYFNAWAQSAMRSRLEPVKKVVRMLRDHAQGLRV